MERFDTDTFAEELEAAPENRQVGTRVLFENDRIRVWELLLRPGERAPFHHHALDYFWTCVSPGEVVQRFADGTMEQRSCADGQTVFTPCASEPVIHDLENAGDTTLRFVTVELDPGSAHER